MINEFFKCIDNNDFKTAKEVLRKWNPQNDELVDCQIHLAKLLAQSTAESPPPKIITFLSLYSSYG